MLKKKAHERLMSEARFDDLRGSPAAHWDAYPLCHLRSRAILIFGKIGRDRNLREVLQFSGNHCKIVCSQRHGEFAKELSGWVLKFDVVMGAIRPADVVRV